MDIIHSRPRMKISAFFIVFFSIMQLFFGFDFGLVKLVPKKYKIYAKFVWFAMSCLEVLFIVVHFYENLSFNMELSLTVEYLIYCLPLTISKCSACDYLTDLLNLDSNSNTLNSTSQTTRDSVKTILYMLAVINCKIFLTIAHCMFLETTKCDEIPVSKKVLFIVLYVGLEVPFLVQFMVLYTAYCRMNLVKQALSNNKCDIKEILKIYKVIADCVDKIKPLFNSLFILTTSINVTKFICMVHANLRNVIDYENWMTFLLDYFYTVHILILLCLPIIPAEMLAGILFDMDLELNNRLIEQCDGDQRRDVKKLLRYIEARPLRYKVWNIVPVAFWLPICVFIICITYLIVLVEVAM